MFCALKGTTSTPASASSRHNPAVTTLLPTSDAVPSTAKAAFTGTPRLARDAPSSGAAFARRTALWDTPATSRLTGMAIEPIQRDDKRLQGHVAASSWRAASVDRVPAVW